MRRETGHPTRTIKGLHHLRRSERGSHIPDFELAFVPARPNHVPLDETGRPSFGRMVAKRQRVRLPAVSFNESGSADSSTLVGRVDVERHVVNGHSTVTVRGNDAR